MEIKKSLLKMQLSMLTLACLLLAACESQPTLAPAAAPVQLQTPAPAKTTTKHKETKLITPAALATAETSAANADVKVLSDGMALYNDGDYSAAIKKLGNAPEIWNGHNKAIQVSALKYMAFSYCVTSRAQLCRQQFERALKIDPSFDLIPSEIGHPIWGPVFLKAKKTK